jgi:hypothetical protein
MLQPHFPDELLSDLATFGTWLPLQLLLFVAPCQSAPNLTLRPPNVRTWPAALFYSPASPASVGEAALLAPWHGLLAQPNEAEYFEFAAGSSLLLVEAVWRLCQQLPPSDWRLAGLHQHAEGLEVWLRDGWGFAHLQLRLLPTGEALWGEVIQAYSTEQLPGLLALLEAL